MDALVKVLGTAQDGGLPQIGCYCQNCLWAREDPLFARSVSSLAIFDLRERKFFLLDATPDIRGQLDTAFERLGNKRSGLRNAPHGILLTHAHIGHYTGLMLFGEEAMAAHKLPVYCSSQMRQFLENNGPWSQLVQNENIAFPPFPLDEEVHLTSQISITPFQVPHRNEFSDTLGLIIGGKKKQLLYIPDIRSWEAGGRPIIEKIENVGVAILDGSFYNGQELPDRDLALIGHPFIETSVEILGSIAEQGKPDIFFTHLNHTNPVLDPEGEPRKKIKERGFKIAFDGMEIVL
ncbi:MAG: MBL fold metallo-hydrolase [Candidatus Hodarchaeales archaeon]|jgi:pyrroloquinoline quinone biosynthesis protein B